MQRSIDEKLWIGAFFDSQAVQKAREKFMNITCLIISLISFDVGLVFDDFSVFNINNNFMPRMILKFRFFLK